MKWEIVPAAEVGVRAHGRRFMMTANTSTPKDRGWERDPIPGDCDLCDGWHPPGPCSGPHIDALRREEAQRRQATFVARRAAENGSEPYRFIEGRKNGCSEGYGFGRSNPDAG